MRQRPPAVAQPPAVSYFNYFDVRASTNLAVNFDLWLWRTNLTYKLGQDEPICLMSKLDVIWFESYLMNILRRARTRTHTQRTDSTTRTTEVAGNKQNEPRQKRT